MTGPSGGRAPPWNEGRAHFTHSTTPHTSEPHCSPADGWREISANHSTIFIHATIFQLLLRISMAKRYLVTCILGRPV